MPVCPRCGHHLVESAPTVCPRCGAGVPAEVGQQAPFSVVKVLLVILLAVLLTFLLMLALDYGNTSPVGLPR